MSTATESSLTELDAPPRPRRASLPLVSYIALVVTMAAVELFIHARGFAYLHMDALVFLPPAVSAARGEGLRNPVWAAARVFDPAGEGRLVYHGFLFPMLLVPLMPSADAAGLLLALAFMQVVVLLVCAVFFWQAAKGERPPAWGDVVLATLGLLAVAATLEGFAGRPEALVMLFVALGGIAAWRRTGWTAEVVVPGILIGLIGVTSPLSGVFAGLVLTTWLSLRHRPPDWALRSAAAAVLAFLTLGVLLLVIFPFEVRALIEGHRRHAGLLPYHSFSYLLPVWAYWPSMPLAGLPWMMAAAVIARHLISRWRDVSYPLLPFCLLLLLAWGFFRFAVQFSPLHYNAMGFLPLVIAILLAARVSRTESPAKPRSRLTMHTLVALALLGPALGFVRHLLLFHCYLNEGMHLDEARATAAPLFDHRRPDDPVYAVGATALLLTERYDCFRASSTEDYPLQATLVVAQYENNICKSFRVLPPLDIRENHFRDQEPRWLGVGLGGSMPGYQFAVGRVIGPRPPKRPE